MTTTTVSFIERKQFAEMYEWGFSTPEIGNLSGIHAGRVHSYIKDLVQIRPWATSGELSNLFRGGSRREKKALREFFNAMETGKLKAPEACEDCGGAKTRKDGRSGIQAHHCDYNKPMDVVWLCQKCHTKWHKENKAIPFSGDEFPSFAKPKKEPKPKVVRIPRFCTVEGCGRKYRMNGFCDSHYQAERVRRLNRGEGRSPCQREGCVRSVYARGLCQSHYVVFRIQERRKQSLDKN